jgi:hypothetical protein
MALESAFRPKVFARAYSKKGKVIVSSLEDYKAKVIPIPMAVNQ